jgi:catechol 2,3-dioxygenase-like lactoylglutathione lyase family enzyme
MPPSSILETALSVADLEQSREFYTRLFGYPILTSDDRLCAFDVQGRQVLLLFLRGSDPEGTHMPFGGHIPAHGSHGRSHVGFAIPEESLDEWREHLHHLNITVESEFTWPRGGRSLYFRDPDGHLLELLTPGVWPTY